MKGNYLYEMDVVSIINYKDGFQNNIKHHHTLSDTFDGRLKFGKVETYYIKDLLNVDQRNYHYQEQFTQGQNIQFQLRMCVLKVLCSGN